MELQFAKKGASDSAVSVQAVVAGYCLFANIKLFFLIRDEAELEFRIIIAEWSGLSSLV